MRPWLSIVCPTIGRPSLVATLDAIDSQSAALLKGVEVLVVGDTYGGPTRELEQVREHVETERPPDRYRYLEHDGGIHCYGQPQRDFGAREAHGEWVWFAQDDNVATPQALHYIYSATHDAGAPRLFIFRVLTYWREVVWREPHLAQGNVDADCLVMRRDIAREVNWGLRYEGDYDAAVQAAKLSEAIGWGTEVVAVARPEQEHRWWR